MEHGDRVCVTADPTIVGYINGSSGPIGGKMEWFMIQGITHPFEQGRTPTGLWWGEWELTLLKKTNGSIPPEVPREKYRQIPNRPSFPA